MKPGDSVFHPDYGRGTITRLYSEGPTAMVDFGYMTELVAIKTITHSNKATTGKAPPRSADPPQSVVSPPPKPSPEPDYPAINTGSVHDEPEIPVTNPKTSPQSDTESSLKPPRSRVKKHPRLAAKSVAARRAVVALRLGQVLESHVDDLSVGLREISQRFDAALERARSHQPVYMLIEGAWGQGKTHLLTLLSAAAVRQEFAVSSVVMDGVGVSLSDPMGLLEAITNSIRFPGDALPGGLAINLARARRQGHLERLSQLGATTLARVFEQIPVAAFDEFDALQVLEDYLCLCLATGNVQNALGMLGYRGLQLPPLRTRSVAERPARFCDLLFNWTQLCAVAGARGLVIILDEMDVEYASTAGRSQQSARLRERRSQLLELLKPLHDQRFPLVLAFASAPAGAGIDPEHDASKNIAENIGVLDDHIVAPVPGKKELKALMTKVFKLYRLAYPDSAAIQDKNVLTSLGERLIGNYQRQANPVPRYFVRSAIEAMDILTSNVERRDATDVPVI